MSPSHFSGGEFAASAAPTRVRWTVCAFLFVATSVNYMDRQALAVLAPVLQAKFGWDETAYGHIVTAFQAAYAIGFLGFGRLIDRYGTRAGYALAVVIWSCAECAHALVRTALGLGLARFGLGLGEGGNFPAAIKAVAEWFPPEERALATGLFNSGCNIGIIFASMLVPPLVENFGWKSGFLAPGLIGFAWTVAWILFYRTQGQHLRPMAGERKSPVPTVPWRVVLRARQSWMYIVGVALSAPVAWFYLYWTPKFLYQRYSIPMGAIGGPMMIIYLCATLGSIGGGYLSTLLIRKRLSVGVARRVTLAISGACAIPVMWAPAVDRPQVAIWLIGLAAAGHMSWAANLFTIVSDLFPAEAVASVVGVGGTASAVTAMGFAEFAGHSLQSSGGNYDGLFRIAGGSYAVAFVLMHLVAPNYQRVETTGNSSNQSKSPRPS
jgi:ACS family hexuronate transporter-like MFS transporter